MLNRLKNAMATLAGDVPDYPASDRRPRGRLRGSSGGETRCDPKRTDGDDRLPYSRPHFLHLSVDEVTASGDKTSRPIILPRDVTKVPWCAGYAEWVMVISVHFNSLPVSGSSLSSWSLFVTLFLVLHASLLFSSCLF